MSRAPSEAINDTEFNDLLDKIMSEVEDRFDKDNSEYKPKLVIAYKDDYGEPIIVGDAHVPDHAYEERQEVMFAGGAAAWDIREKFKGVPIAVFIISEAWMVIRKGDKASDKYAKGEKRVSEAKDKQEVLIIGGMTFDTRSCFAMYTLGRKGGETELKLHNIIRSEDENDETVESSLLVSFWEGVAYAAQEDIKKREGKLSND